MKKRTPPPGQPDTPLQRQITARMKGRGFKNLKELAEAAGKPVTYNVLREIFRKSTMPGGDKVALIASALGCTDKDLLEQSATATAPDQQDNGGVNSIALPSVTPSSFSLGSDKLDQVCTEISAAWSNAQRAISRHEFEDAAIFLRDMREGCELAKALCVIAADDKRKRGRRV